MKKLFRWFALLGLTVLAVTACAGAPKIVGEDGYQVFVQVKSEDEAIVKQVFGECAADYYGNKLDDFCDDIRGEIEEHNGAEFCVNDEEYNDVGDLEEVGILFEVRKNQFEFASYQTAANNCALTFHLTTPGKADDHNADEQNGNTLTWEIRRGRSDTLEASGPMGGTDWLLIGGLLSCLCLIVLIAAGAGVFFYLRKKKAQGG